MKKNVLIIIATTLISSFVLFACQHHTPKQAPKTTIDSIEQKRIADSIYRKKYPRSFDTMPYPNELDPVPDCGSCYPIAYQNYFEQSKEQKKYLGSDFFIEYLKTEFGATSLSMSYYILVADSLLDVEVSISGDVPDKANFKHHRILSSSQMKLLKKELAKCKLHQKKNGVPYFVETKENPISNQGKEYLAIKSNGIDIKGGWVSGVIIGSDHTDYDKYDSIDYRRSTSINGDFHKAVNVIKSILTKEELKTDF